MLLQSLPNFVRERFLHYPDNVLSGCKIRNTEYTHACPTLMGGQLTVIIIFLYRGSHVLFERQFLNGILDDVMSRFFPLFSFYILT